jgi:anti-sigma B factor antagonist
MHEFHLDAVESSGGCAVLRVRGEVDVFTASAVRERVRDLAADGVVHIIADMSGVVFLDSTGLGALVGGLKRVRAHDGSLTLANGADQILRVLQITGLAKVFQAHPSVQDAIAADPHWRQMAESEAGSIGEWCLRHGLS